MVVFTPIVTTKVIEFEATIPRTLNEDKINQVVTYSTATTRNETFTGTIKKFSINVSEMTASNYDKMMFLFRNAITFQIKDTITGFEDSAQYTFDGSSLGLTHNDDKSNSELIYSGSVPIVCITGS